MGTAGVQYLGDNEMGKTYHRYLKTLSVLGFSWLIVSGVYILTRGTSKGVSIVAITMHMAVAISYLAYALMRNDSVHITGSIVSICLNMFVLTSIFVVNAPVWGKPPVELGGRGAGPQPSADVDNAANVDFK